MKHSSRGKRNRRLGFDGERYYAKIFRELGFEHCITSRQGSRIHDDSKIDLIFLPYNIQIKTGVQRGLNPRKELKSMAEKIIENFPEYHPVHGFPKVLFWKKPPGRGHNSDEYDELAIMTVSEFLKLVKQLKKCEEDENNHN